MYKIISRTVNAKCSYTFLVEGHLPGFYNQFGLTVSKFQSLPNGEKLQHLNKLAGKIPGVHIKSGSRVPIDIALRDYPIVDFSTQVTKNGVEMTFCLSGSVRNRLKAASISPEDRKSIMSTLTAIVTSLASSSPDVNLLDPNVIRQIARIGGTLSLEATNPNYKAFSKHLPKKFDKTVFDNGDKNTYDSPWMSLTDAQQQTIAKRVATAVSKQLKATAKLPYSQRRLMQANRSTGKAAGAVIYCTSTGRCLWVKRSQTCDAPGTWACLGGGVENGETIVQGLRRELMEEGGINNPISFTPFYCQRDPDFSYYNFIGTVDQEFDPVLNDEHVEFQWSEEVPTPCHPGLDTALRTPSFRRTLGQTRTNLLAKTSLTAEQWVEKVEKKQKGKYPRWVPPKGFFTKSPPEIANGLKQNSKDYAEASRRLTFYINRAGDNLDTADKARLEKAREILKQRYKK